MNDWNELDEEMNSSQVEDDVQYVGLEEDEGEELVRQPVRAPRRPVQRVRPMQNGNDYAMPRNGVVSRSNGNGTKEPFTYYPTIDGTNLKMNDEALTNLSKAKLQDIDGKPAYRIQPGTYVMVVPGKNPRRQDQQMGFGTNGDTPATTAQRQPTTWESVANLFGEIAHIGTSIGETVVGARREREQAATDRLRMQIEAEASAASRRDASAESRRVHEERMAEIRQSQAELAELQRTQAAADAVAALAPATGPAVAGISPVVWVVLALVGVGGIGGLIWFLTREKKD